MNTAGQTLREINSGIYRLDVNHPQPQITCCYLIVKDKAVAIIDCGGGWRGTRAVMEGLQSLAIAPRQVLWLLATHAHLDHAGAAGQLMRELPRATFAAHPSALKHLLDPQQALVPASQALYGSKFFDTYYSGICPVPRQRAQALQDGELIPLGTQALHALYTPGHAWHHISFHDPEHAFVAAGDAYGISYRALDNHERLLLVPATPPSQLNPSALIQSLHRLNQLQVKQIGLAHFDILEITGDDQSERYTQMLTDALQQWQRQAETLFAQAPERFYENMKAYLLDWVSDRATELGLCGQTARRLHNNDISLSAGGFEYFLKKQTAA